jgi:hypothetical protein
MQSDGINSQLLNTVSNALAGMLQRGGEPQSSGDTDLERVAHFAHSHSIQFASGTDASA